jgi:hypothetical protein
MYSATLPFKAVTVSFVGLRCGRPACALPHAVAAVLAAHRHLRIGIDRNDQVGCEQAGGGDRDRCQQTTVDQIAVTDTMRRENHRHRDGGTDRIEQRAPGQPVLALDLQISCHRDEGQRQLLDLMVADQLTQDTDDPIPLDQAGVTEGEIKQPQHAAAFQRTDPALVLGQLAGGVNATDQRAHRRAGDRRHFITLLFQHLDHADMRQPARAASAEDQRHAR